MKRFLLIGAVLFLAPLVSAAQSISCAQAMSAPSVQLVGSPTCVGTTCSYTDTTPVNNSVYGYVSVATDMAGSSCSNIIQNVVIPATGAHTVNLTFTASTTSNVTYAIFRAPAPTAPVGLTVTVN